MSTLQTARARPLVRPWKAATWRPRAPISRPRTPIMVFAADKVVWVSTNNKDVVTAALESGITTLLFSNQQQREGAARQLAAWRQLGRFTAVTSDDQGGLLDEKGKAVGVLRVLSGPEDVKAAEKDVGRQGVVVVDAQDWQIIPAENLVAAFQSAGSTAQLLAVAGSCQDGRVMLEALEAGTHGVVLRTEDPKEVRQLAAYLAQRASQRAQRLQYTPATVTRVAAVGMGDRACVDLASMLVPGEGLCVGSFARGLFLVHSECSESSYINSRPFRVNAGPVHSYVRMPGGRTAYLSELKAGAEVVVCDAEGREATAIVGRVKIEARPLVLVEARTPDGDSLSVLLQNAETVKLIGPTPATAAAGAAAASEPLAVAAAGAPSPGPQHQQQGEEREAAAGAAAAVQGLLPQPQPHEQQLGLAAEEAAAGAGPGCPGASWQAIPVSSLREGDQVFVLLQHGARHTGISIQERVREV